MLGSAITAVQHEMGDLWRDHRGLQETCNAALSTVERGVKKLASACACACSVRAPLFFFFFSIKKKQRKLGGEEEEHNHQTHTRTAHSAHTGERAPQGPGHRTRACTEGNKGTRHHSLAHR